MKMFLPQSPLPIELERDASAQANRTPVVYAFLGYALIDSIHLKFWNPATTGDG